MSDQLSSRQLARLDNLSIVFAPVTIKAFSKEQGYWTKYEDVKKAGLTEITVTPRLEGHVLDGQQEYIDLRCEFDPEKFPQDLYGIVYGDREFENNMDAHIRQIMGYPLASPDSKEEDLQIIYTESGMQTDDEISMEARQPFRIHLADLSNHALLALTKSDKIDIISIGDFVWQRPGRDL